MPMRRCSSSQSQTRDRDARSPEPDDLVLLCQSDAGYRNLLKLVSSAYLKTLSPETPQISWDDLESPSDGLLCLTGGVAGPVGRLLSEGGPVEDWVKLMNALGVLGQPDRAKAALAAAEKALAADPDGLAQVRAAAEGAGVAP